MNMDDEYLQLLADVGTVDDRGRLIPLSQRFNEDSPDLRNPMKPVASNNAKAHAFTNGRHNTLSHRGFHDRTNRPKAGGRQAGNPAARHNPVEDRDEKYYWLRIDELRKQALELRSKLPLTPEGSVDVKRATPEQLAAAIDLDRQLLDVERELKLIAHPPSGISYSKPAPKTSVVREGPAWAQQLHRELVSSRPNPMTRSLRQKLATILEDDDRVLDYDRASGEELYRLYDVVVTDQPLNGESLTEIEGLLDDNGVLVILSGEMPSGLGDHFKRAVRHRGMLLVQHPKNPEEARIKAEQARREA